MTTPVETVKVKVTKKRSVLDLTATELKGKRYLDNDDDSDSSSSSMIMMLMMEVVMVKILMISLVALMNLFQILS